MCAQETLKREVDLSVFVQQFLNDHPEVRDTLDLFGITYDRYQQYLAAQQAPVFYTASSTTEGGSDGQLD
jgi:hypothetical protein